MLKISDCRKEKGISQKELAKYLNISAGNLCEWEKGRIEPSLFFLIKIADYFKCSVDYLLGREDDFGNIINENSDLNIEEQKIINTYRSLNTYEKNIVLKFLNNFNEKDIIQTKNTNLNK